MSQLMTIMQFDTVLLCIFKVFQSEDEPLWLKHVAQINTMDNIVVLMALSSFIKEKSVAPIGT